jgi:SAM-dependent methyltransferase
MSPAAPLKSTDWDRYYHHIPATAKVTRMYTTAALVRAIKRFAQGPDGRALAMVEIGGANSCFLDRMLGEFGPRSYEVVDTNQYGLKLLARQANAGGPLHLHRESVLSMSLPPKADVVFSVGLVEHFTPPDTRAAVLAHFDVLRPGGLAIITFPTPTPLYRTTRGLIEAIGQWKFHDERPLEPSEVLDAMRERGEILYQKTLWPLMLTQHLVVARKV